MFKLCKSSFFQGFLLIFLYLLKPAVSFTLLQSQGGQGGEGVLSELNASIVKIRPRSSAQFLADIISELSSIGITSVSDLGTKHIYNSPVYQAWLHSYKDVNGLTPFEVHAERNELDVEVIRRRDMLILTPIYDSSYRSQTFLSKILPPVMLLILRDLHQLHNLTFSLSDPSNVDNVILPKIYFSHIPKNGGSTVSQSFLDYCQPDEISCNYCKSAKLGMFGKRNKCNILAGHHGVGIEHFVNLQYHLMYLVILRHPVTRVRSQWQMSFSHRKEKRKHGLNMFIPQDLVVADGGLVDVSLSPEAFLTWFHTAGQHSHIFEVCHNNPNNPDNPPS